MQEATLRPRAHGDASPSAGIARPGSPTAELKRRRANVLFILVLTTLCAGFLAATTDSKAMVYVFALAMLALGGYVYLLVTLNQRETNARGYEAEYRAASQPRRQVPRQAEARQAPRQAPARRQAAPRRRPEYDFDDLDEFEGYDRPVRRSGTRPAPVGPASASPRRVGRPPADRQSQQTADFPGAGVSGRISYGRQRDPYAMPAREPDGFGWEIPAHEPTRRNAAPARNGRHATGQQQAVRRRHYSTAG